jgi:heme exporter protein D
MALSITPVTKKQWGKIVQAFFYVGVSFLLAALPVWLAHNATYIALAVPINVALVTLKQLITKDEQQALAEVPPALQPEVNQVVAKIESEEPVLNGVDQLTTPEPAAPAAPPTKIEVTDEAGNLVTDPNAPR